MKIGLFLAEIQAFLGIEIVKVTENRLKSHIVKMADSFRKMPVGDLMPVGKSGVSCLDLTLKISIKYSF